MPSLAPLFAAVAILFTSTTVAVNRVPDVVDHRSAVTASSSTEDGLRHVASINDYGYNFRSGGRVDAGGSDIEFFSQGGRNFAVLGLLNENSRIVDITNPEAPFGVLSLDCDLNQNDVQVAQSGEQTVLIFAADNYGDCALGDGRTRFVGFATLVVPQSLPTRNQTPLQVQPTGIARDEIGAHNTTVHPNGHTVYISSNNSTATSNVHIWDISNPSAPKDRGQVTYFAGVDPHDLTFNADGSRAYVASINHTDILDTTDPENPSLISSFVHPNISISHQADPTPDGRFLLVTDEFGGGSFSPFCPGGGIHVYWIEGALERAPVLVGSYFIDNTELRFDPLGCTAHVFRINPDSRTLSMAWYSAGVLLIDLSEIIDGVPVQGVSVASTEELPVRVGGRTLASAQMAGADTWSAKMTCLAPGYVFANDMGRGFDVFKITVSGYNQGC